MLDEWKIVDSDQMPFTATFNRVLHCLLRPICPNTLGKKAFYLLICVFRDELIFL